MKRLTERRKAELQKLAEKKKEQKEQKDEQGSDHEKTPERSASRVSQKTIDRLSMPRVPKTPPADSFKEKATPPKDKVIPPKDKTTPPKDKVTPPRATPTQTKDRASTPTQMKVIVQTWDMGLMFCLGLRSLLVNSSSAYSVN